MQKASQIILGVDPGTRVMGYSVLLAGPQSVQLVEMSVLKFNSRLGNYERLQQIHQKITELVQHHRPDSFAIEAPFFGKNVQSMLKLGRAQGVAIAAAIQAGLEVFEYAPKKVKQSITGNGNAGKEQVWEMLQRLLTIQRSGLHYLDASDALAVAVCHHFQQSRVLQVPRGNLKSWQDFIRQNPERIKSS